MKKDILKKAYDKLNPENKIFSAKNIDISQQVLAILEEKGWTQKDLAQKLGKYESDVSRMLSGLQNLTLKTITKLEAVLESDIIITPLKAKEKFSKKNYVTLKYEVKRNGLETIDSLKEPTLNWDETTKPTKFNIA